MDSRGTTPFPSDVVERNLRDGFWHPEVLAASILRWAKETPDRDFIVDPRGRLTYREAADRMLRAARGLHALGLRPGDRMLVQLPNWAEGVILHFALEWLGVVSVPLPPTYRAKEIGYIGQLTEAKAAAIAPRFGGFDYLEMYASLRGSLPSLQNIVAVGDAAAVDRSRVPGVEVHTFEELVGSRADACPPLDVRADPNRLAQIHFTSGSTGDPKGVMHTSNTLTCENEAGIAACGVTGADVIFMPLSIGHGLGMDVGVRTPAIVGATVVFVDKWEPERAVEIMARERVSYLVTTPTFLVDVLQAKNLAEVFGLPSLRVWMLAGAVVGGALHDEARAKLPHMKIAHAFGMTELGALIIKAPGAPPEKQLATGLAARGLEVRVLDPSGDEAPVGVAGELALRSPSLFLGYYGHADLTAACMTADGFFLTGDQVRRDEDGWIWVTGRIKDLIKRGGVNVSPLEIEEAILKHPHVADVAVIGLADPRLGERICAVVVARPGATVTHEEIVECLRSVGAAKHKWPERLELVHELPRTSIGKVHKAALRERFTP